jgi:NAD-dependent SIR2 family protein deacetylase
MRVEKGGNMPYFHCNSCHHEFEGYPEKKGAECTNPKCDWCGGDSYILEEKTPLEKMCEGDTIEKMLKELVAYEHQKGNNNR